MTSPMGHKSKANKTPTVEQGSRAPDFALKDHHGKRLALADFLGQKNVVLAFTPLAWTPV
jgi:mycoredoxin-dependent peroxiredoxin